MRRCLGAFIGVAAVLLVFVAPVAACAAPPGPGWVRDPITDLVSMFGPTLLAFGVPAFFALRTRSVPFKWVGVLAAIGFAVVVFTFTLLLAPRMPTRREGDHGSTALREPGRRSRRTASATPC